MPPRYLMSLDFVDGTRLDPSGSGRLVETRPWLADDPDDSDTVAARNQAVAAAAIRQWPSLTMQGHELI